MEPGRILGHEAVGTVEEVGPAVRGIKIRSGSRRS
ncbi:alcohol dehydrogenase catalytic domain-containing protein [Umezawaea sp. Da 62-37]|nr:alcohol dehydrogenase catalytic domain-containing protein [Umezawaea sp. Da 62-37]WNV84785.1 alcohol dehydrogenase catalytic domain-containing protein [Umezawaea sp. Da 62-37]